MRSKIAPGTHYCDVYQMFRERLGKCPVSLLFKAVGASTPAVIWFEETKK
jgi:hypothetical protein